MFDYCNCYKAGADPTDLPCGGCKFCVRAHNQWGRFELDVDDVVPLAVGIASPVIATMLVRTEQSQNNPMPNISKVTGPLLGEDGTSEADSEGETPWGSNWLTQASPSELSRRQHADSDLDVVMKWMGQPHLPSSEELFSQSRAVKHYWLSRPQLLIQHGVLFYRWVDDEIGRDRLLLVVPKGMVAEVLEGCHDNKLSGHFCHPKTLAKLRRGFYWYGRTRDCELYTRTCAKCSTLKHPRSKPKAALGSYHAGNPMERVHVDILGPFPISARGNKYVVMIVDQFTKWLECFPLPDQTAETVAKAVVDGFISRHGCPLVIHTDQGRQFEGNLFQGVCSLLGIAKTRTTPYRPCSNGQVERYNRTLLQLIRCYLEDNQASWDEHLQLLAGAIRSMENRQTGFSANFMMFGREIVQPVDLIVGTALTADGFDSPASYVKNLRDELQRAHSLAGTRLKSAVCRQKKDYDVRLNQHQYETGDLVYRVNSATKIGQSKKLQAIWKGPLLVVEVVSPILYRVRGRRRDTVVHHDLLKLCSDRFVPQWMVRVRRDFLSKSSDVPEAPVTTAGLDIVQPGHDQVVDVAVDKTTPVHRGKQIRPPTKDRKPPDGDQPPTQLPTYTEEGTNVVMARPKPTTRSGRQVNRPARFL